MRNTVAMLTQSPGREDWETPPHIFNPLNAEFGFTLDVCASPENAKVRHYLSKEDNGLSLPWYGVCWCNPPYGRETPAWVRKAVATQALGATVVMLLPARTDTKWWHDHVIPHAEVRFVRGRIRFVGAPHTAPFPSAVVIFRGDEVDS